MGKRRQLTSKSSKQKLTRPAGVSKPQPKPQSQPKKKHAQASQTKPIIPFERKEKILLVGEGDLSFSRCLVEVHKCKDVTATVLEGSEEELVGKYPQAQENIEVIREGEGVVKCGVDVARKNGLRVVGAKGGFERVFFNFPHVGGKSTDVNRQVRYNQGISPSNCPSAFFSF